MPKGIIVAIDGPSGAGKSTVGRLLAKALGYLYIDTGAMYRAIGWKAAKEGIAPVEGPALEGLCGRTDVALKQAGSGLLVCVDGMDVTALIRTPEMSMAASAVSAQPCVRARLLELQREMGKKGGVVMEGRDIGTVVFPDAQAKFFLVADIEERARRRWAELKARGEASDLERTREEVRRRDYDDSHRAIAPLRSAPDAMVFYTTSMDVGEVVRVIKTRVEEIIRDGRS